MKIKHKIQTSGNPICIVSILPISNIYGSGYTLRCLTNFTTGGWTNFLKILMGC